MTTDDGLPISRGYDAGKSTRRRRAVSRDMRHEDAILKVWDRDRLISSSRTLIRNASIVRYAVNTHLDYVSTFSFQSATGDKDLDTQIEQFMERWADECDVTGRHSLSDLVRLIERLAVTDGDVLIQQISDGKIQVIEGDRVRTPHNMGDYKGSLDPTSFVHGVRVSPAGRSLDYAVCDRLNNSFRLRSVIPARYVWHHGYFDRVDQTRGVSPLASAINTFCDVYESTEYALAKMKLSQLFAVKIKRANEEGGSDDYEFDFGSGPQMLDLDAGDEVEFLESNSPGGQFSEFLQRGIEIGLKALDIPYSFFNESYTNYSGARQALVRYESSSRIKRRRLQRLLDKITRWRIGLAVLDGDLVLPDGMTVADLKWEWIPAGQDWIDPLKEWRAHKIAITEGFTSRHRIAKRLGVDWEQIAAELAREEEMGFTRDGAPEQIVEVNDDDE